MTKKFLKKNKNQEIDLAWQEFLLEMDRLRKEQDRIIREFEQKLVAKKRAEIIKKLD